MPQVGCCGNGDKMKIALPIIYIRELKEMKKKKWTLMIQKVMIKLTNMTSV
jgi:hypothetical protein